MSEEKVLNSVNSLDQKLKNTTKLFTESEKALKEKIAAINQGIAIIGGSLRDLDDSSDTVLRNITSKEEDVASQKKMNEKLKSAIQNLEHELDVKTKELATEKATKTTLSKQNEELDAELLKARDEQNQLDKQLAELKKQREALKPDFENQKTTIDKKMAEIQQTKGKLLLKYKALLYLNSKDYYKQKMPELHILDLINDQKTVSLDVLSASTGRPLAFVEKIVQSLVRRGLAKRDANTVTLTKAITLKGV